MRSPAAADFSYNPYDSAGPKFGIVGVGFGWVGTRHRSMREVA